MATVLNQFSEQKIIDWYQNEIVVVDEPELRSLAKLEM
jgi:hypothetical protein